MLMQRPSRNRSVFRRCRPWQLLTIAMVAFIGCLGESGGSGGDSTGKNEELEINSSGPRDFRLIGDELFFHAGVRRGDAGIRRLVWTIETGGVPVPVQSLDDVGIGVVDYFNSPPVVFADRYYFVGEDRTRNYRLWYSDGANAVEAMPDWPAIPDWASNGDSPRLFTPVGEFIYFAATDRAEQDGIWRVDSSGAYSFVVARPEGFRPRAMYAYGDRLMIQTYGSGDNRGQLWELVPGNDLKLVLDARTEEFAVFDGLLYFSVDDIDGGGMWIYDGVAPPVLILDEIVGQKVEFGDDIYFLSHAIPESTYDHPPVTLWAYDREDMSARRPIFIGGAHLIGDFGGDFLFVSSVLWRTDGIPPALFASDWAILWDRPAETFIFDDAIFHAGKDDFGVELWKYDGVTDAHFADLSPGEYCDRG